MAKKKVAKKATKKVAKKAAKKTTKKVSKKTAKNVAKKAPKKVSKNDYKKAAKAIKENYGNIQVDGDYIFIDDYKISKQNYDSKTDEFKYSTTTVNQGGAKFYTLAIDSKVLGETCYVSDRDENPEDGFQRVLNFAKVQEIANYVDTIEGSIPTSVIISAQQEHVTLDRNKTLRFKNVNNAFMIIDGQHRVYGYKLAQTNCKVPVVVYVGLTKQEEAKLFIDINVKQTPVPESFVLEIKRFAKLEKGNAVYINDLFDLFHDSENSALQGLTSKTGSTKTKINRAKFKNGINPLISTGIISPEKRLPDEMYKILNNYFWALKESFPHNFDELIMQGKYLTAFCKLFSEAAKMNPDRINYPKDGFDSVLAGDFSKIKKSELNNCVTYTDLFELFKKKLSFSV